MAQKTPATIRAAAFRTKSVRTGKLRGSIAPAALNRALSSALNRGKLVVMHVANDNGDVLYEEQAIVCGDGFVEVFGKTHALCQRWPIDAFIRTYFRSAANTSDDATVRRILATATIREKPAHSRAVPGIEIDAVPKPDGGDEEDMFLHDDLLEMATTAHRLSHENPANYITFTASVPEIDHHNAAAKVYQWLRSTAITPPPPPPPPQQQQQQDSSPPWAADWRQPWY